MDGRGVTFMFYMMKKVGWPRFLKITRNRALWKMDRILRNQSLDYDLRKVTECDIEIKLK